MSHGTHLWRDTNEDPPPDDTEIAGGWITPAGHIDVLLIAFDSTTLTWVYDDMPCTPPHAWHPLPCIPPDQPPTDPDTTTVKPPRTVTVGSLVPALVGALLAALAVGVLLGTILPGGVDVGQWVPAAVLPVTFGLLALSDHRIRRR